MLKQMETLTVSEIQSQIPFVIKETGQIVFMKEGELAIQSNNYPTTYQIIVEKDEDGRIVVTCPSLKGVVTDGKDIDEAIKNAYEAIHVMLESLGKDAEHFILTYNTID